MKKLILGLIAALVATAAYATLKEDITSQGNLSFLHKTITAQKLATTVRDYEVVTVANVIVDTECGTTYFLNSATEFASTLPAPVAGCWFKFIVKAAPAGANYTVGTNGGANVIFGSAEVIGAVVAAADEDSINFVQTVGLAGDWVEVVSDGTNWYVEGMGVAVGSITFTAT